MTLLSNKHIAYVLRMLRSDSVLKAYGIEEGQLDKSGRRNVELRVYIENETQLSGIGSTNAWEFDVVIEIWQTTQKNATGDRFANHIVNEVIRVIESDALLGGNVSFYAGCSVDKNMGTDDPTDRVSVVTFTFQQY